MTDRDFLLSVLNDGKEHSHAEILQASFAERGCGLTVHSRASDLRQLGFNIACSVEDVNGRRASSYQLLPSFSERDHLSPDVGLPAPDDSRSRSEKEVEQLSLDVPYRVPEWA